MAEQRRFLASDLSQELGLPRSTINDWLTRYAEYLESENRGKRRFYSEKSLSILREIAELRNAGNSSFEIEQQLAARYGIRPEVAHPEEPEVAAPEESAATPPAPEDNPAALPGDGETLPMLRPAFDEMSSQFTREFTALAGKFEELERERRRMLRRMWGAGLAIMAAGLLLLLLLGAALWTLHGKFEQSSVENAAAVETLTRSGEKLSDRVESMRAEQRQESEKIGVLLDRSRADFQRNAEQLRSELAEQRKGFERRLAELSADAEKKLQAETLRLKEEFARKQQQELREQAASYEKKISEAKAGTAAAEDAAARARRENGELRRRVEELEKSRPAEKQDGSAVKPGSGAEK